MTHGSNMLDNRPVIKSSRFLEKAKQIAGITWILAALACSSLVHSKDQQNSSRYIDTLEIQGQIEEFLTQLISDANIPSDNLEVTPHKISQTLKLNQCTKPLTFQRENANQDFYGRNTIKVSCKTPKWSFYSGATVKAYGTVVTAATPIAKGELITAQHLVMTRINRAKITGNSLTDTKEIIGLAAKRPIRQGKVINKHQFERPKLISRGDGVTIQAVGKSMTVSTAGQAMSHGRLGDNIRVKNLKSDREIIAKVKDKDTVVVMLY